MYLCNEIPIQFCPGGNSAKPIRIKKAEKLIKKIKAECFSSDVIEIIKTGKKIAQKYKGKVKITDCKKTDKTLALARARARLSREGYKHLADSLDCILLESN